MSSLPHRDRVYVAFVMAAVVVIMAAIISAQPQAPAESHRGKWTVVTLGEWQPQDANVKRAEADCDALVPVPKKARWRILNEPQIAVINNCMEARGYSRGPSHDGFVIRRKK